uniref:CSON005887 protein n=1 Tax=Culicoides sonorensis TaxID=179676 RepID=A0A336KAJ2_CULSO
MVKIVLHDKTRDEIREERSEFNLIVKRCNELGFEYVLKPREFTSKGLCFGTKLPREVLPLQGPCLSPFMRYCVSEANSKIGPGSYCLKKPEKHIPNIYGLISKANRFPVVGGNDIKTKYLNDDFYDVRDIGKKIFKKDYKPFGSSSKEIQFSSHHNIPGVGTYNLQPKRRKPQFKHSFGGAITPIFPVNVICSPYHLDKCTVCDLTPISDYFKNSKNDQSLCQKCMLTRYCDFYHQHENTTAKVRLLDPKVLRLKLRREHYLISIESGVFDGILNSGSVFDWFGRPPDVDDVTYD